MQCDDSCHFGPKLRAPGRLITGLPTKRLPERRAEQEQRPVHSSLPCYSAATKAGDMLRIIQADGWYLVATRGSHRQFKHADKPGRVTVPGKPSDALAPGTLNSILKQARLKS